MFGLMMALLRLVGVTDVAGGRLCERCGDDVAGGGVLIEDDTPFGVHHSAYEVCWDCKWDLALDYDSAGSTTFAMSVPYLDLL